MSQIDARALIARRVAAALRPGEVVNVGIGIPTAVAEFVDPTAGVVLQSENGVLGVGAPPGLDAIDPELIDAGKQPITVLPGASFFSSADSFAMIRGGHIDVSVLGALQVDSRGLIANWSAPGKPVLGVGGAMDLLVGAGRVIVATKHLDGEGRPKLVERCTMPVTGVRRVDLIVTEHASFSVDDDGLTVEELVAGTTLGWLRANTRAQFMVAAGVFA